MPDWKNHTKTYLKNQLLIHNITHDMLVNLLEKIGIKETKASIDNKLSRGTFSATFLFQCRTAIKINGTNELVDYENQKI